MNISTLSTAQQHGDRQFQADRHKQKVLGNALRRLYAGVIAEPIPAEFLLLLAEMDRKQAAVERAR
jgi:hypothetical protein